MARRVVKAGIDPTAVKAATKVGVRLTPEQIAASGTEHAHQAALFQWVALIGRERWSDLETLFAIPNGGDRGSAWAGAQMKAEGVKPGVPDMCLPVPAGRFASLYLELKRPGLERREWGARSDEQVKWHLRLRRLGHAVVTAYGWDSAVWALEAYYRGELEMPEDGDALLVALRSGC